MFLHNIHMSILDAIGFFQEDNAEEEVIDREHELRQLVLLSVNRQPEPDQHGTFERSIDKEPFRFVREVVRRHLTRPHTSWDPKKRRKIHEKKRKYKKSGSF